MTSNRASLVINPVSGHLLEACQNTHKPVRQYAAKALCSLVALHIEQNVHVNGLRPMQLLSEVQFVDVKTIQVEFLERIIDKHGNEFDFEQWVGVLEMVRSACLVKNDEKVMGAVDEVLKSGLLQKGL